MVSCGLLAKTVKASQSIESVKPESMDSIELLYGALWVAPPCCVTKTGAIPVRPAAYWHAARTGFASRPRTTRLL